VADHLGLLAHGLVRLIVFVRAGPELGRIVAARDRLFREIVRLTPAFIDEVERKVEPAPVSGQLV
jgi:hypothetical protein